MVVVGLDASYEEEDVDRVHRDNNLWSLPGPQAKRLTLTPTPTLTLTLALALTLTLTLARPSWSTRWSRPARPPCWCAAPLVCHLP